MDDQAERAIQNVVAPLSSSTRPSVLVAAPIGAVSRKDRERAAKTSLRRKDASNLLLRTELPGSASLQRRGADGTWETLDVHPVPREGDLRIELPQDAAPPSPTFRVVFSPKNTNITSWISQDVDS